VLLIVMQGTVVGIWPLVRRCLDTRWGPVRCLTSPFGHDGFWQGPIGPHLAASLHTALHHVHNGARDWDVVQFFNLPSQSWLMTRLFTALQAQGFQPQRDLGDDIGLIDLSSGWDAYWESRPAVLHAACQTSEHTWGAAADLRHVTYRSGDGAMGRTVQLQRLLNRLAELNPPGCENVGTLCSARLRGPLTPAVLSHLSPVAAHDSAGDVEVHGLERDGQIQAGAVNLRLADSWFNVGLAADHPAALPVVMRDMLEHRARRGDGPLRMCLPTGCGWEAWYTESLPSHRIQCFGGSVRSQLLKWNRKLQGLFRGRRQTAAQDARESPGRRTGIAGAGTASGAASVALDRRVEPGSRRPHLRIHRGRESVED